MVSRLSRASTDPGNINEHAPNTSSTSTRVTSALHAAHPKQATIARAANRTGGSTIDVQTYRTKDWTGPVDQVSAVTSTVRAYARRRRVNIVTQKKRRAGKGLTRHRYRTIIRIASRDVSALSIWGNVRLDASNAHVPTYTVKRCIAADKRRLGRTMT
jgi:hypothetical protein